MGVVGSAPTKAVARAESMVAPLSGALASTPKRQAQKAVTAASGEAWIALSLDGFLHYRFHRSKGADSDVALWISADGDSWIEADVISVTKIGTGSDSTEYEAIIDPLDTGDFVWVISENPPLGKKE